MTAKEKWLRINEKLTKKKVWLVVDLLVLLIIIYADLTLFGGLIKPHVCTSNIQSVLVMPNNGMQICKKPFTNTWLWCSINPTTKSVLCSNQIAPDPRNLSKAGFPVFNSPGSTSASSSLGRP